jgi:hypothetical protein
LATKRIQKRIQVTSKRLQGIQSGFKIGFKVDSKGLQVDSKWIQSGFKGDSKGFKWIQSVFKGFYVVSNVYLRTNENRKKIIHDTTKGGHLCWSNQWPMGALL